MTSTLSVTDYLAMGPLLILLILSLVLLLVEAFCKNKSILLSLVTLAGLAFALYDAAYSPESPSALLTPWLKFDSISRFFSVFFLGVGFVTVLISSPFFKQFETSRGEYYFFLVASLFGLLLISYSNDFLTLFLGLETLSIALYVLCGYVKKCKVSHEAAFKYFLLGSISTSFLLFGIALVYGALGSTSFALFSTKVQTLSHANYALFMAGVALITMSLLFKAACVPFHVWAPDVYSGAPTPVTAFMAVGTKAGAFAALIRLFLGPDVAIDPQWHKVIALIAYPTLIYANFVAMQQTQLRRFFAYSGISHAGFLLIPLAAGGPDATSSMLFYLVIYAIATLGGFSVLAFFDDTSEGATLNDLRGIFYTSPVKACILTLSLLTLGGIPPTVGFFAKFYLLKVAFTQGYIGLVIVGLLMTILSAYYYLRIVAVMFSEKRESTPKLELSLPASVAGVLSFASIIALTLYPEPFLNILAK